MTARAPSAHNTGEIISIETIDPLTGERTFTRFGADSAPPALRNAAHGANMSAAPGRTQPANCTAQATPHALGVSHNDLQQPAAEHRQGNALRMPLNTTTVDPSSAHASRSVGTSALSLAGIPPHIAPDHHTTHITPRPYRPPVATIPALQPPLSAAAVCMAQACTAVPAAVHALLE